MRKLLLAACLACAGLAVAAVDPIRPANGTDVTACTIDVMGTCDNEHPEVRVEIQDLNGTVVYARDIFFCVSGEYRGTFRLTGMRPGPFRIDADDETGVGSYTRHWLTVNCPRAGPVAFAQTAEPPVAP